MVEPEIYEVLDWLTEEADALGLTLLPEVHAEPGIQSRLAEHGYWVYDFVLPLARAAHDRPRVRVRS